MFNETFWFFYWIEMVARIHSMAAILAFLLLTGAVMAYFGTFYSTDKGDIKLNRMAKFAAFPIGLLMLFTAVFVPHPRRSMAAQHSTWAPRRSWTILCTSSKTSSTPRSRKPRLRQQNES